MASCQPAIRSRRGARFPAHLDATRRSASVEDRVVQNVSRSARLSRSAPARSAPAGPASPEQRDRQEHERQAGTRMSPTSVRRPAATIRRERQVAAAAARARVGIRTTRRPASRPRRRSDQRGALAADGSMPPGPSPGDRLLVQRPVPQHKVRGPLAEPDRHDGEAHRSTRPPVAPRESAPRRCRRRPGSGERDHGRGLGRLTSIVHSVARRRQVLTAARILGPWPIGCGDRRGVDKRCSSSRSTGRAGRGRGRPRSWRSSRSSPTAALRGGRREAGLDFDADDIEVEAVERDAGDARRRSACRRRSGGRSRPVSAGRGEAPRGDRRGVMDGVRPGGRAAPESLRKGPRGGGRDRRRSSTTSTTDGATRA